VDYKDYYAVLGVPRDATPEQIKKAFRQLARRYHPDTAKDPRTAEDKFKEINEAYEVLGDPARRTRYDELGARWREEEAAAAAGGGWGAPRSYGGTRTGAPEDFEFHFDGTGFSDFFEQFFGGRARQGPGGTSETFHFEAEPRRRAGADVEGDLLVTLEEVLKGAVREVSVRLTNPATGETQTRTYRVKVPRGVHEGQIIRLAGAGQPGTQGGPAGDLLLCARLAQHPDFQVRGTDLYQTIDLAPWEAVLGTKIEVTTLDGRISLRVPPGTAAGQTFRVSGHGLPNAGGRRGDLYLETRLQTPTPVGDEERKLWRELSRISRFKARGS